MRKTTSKRATFDWSQYDDCDVWGGCCALPGKPCVHICQKDNCSDCMKAIELQRPHRGRPKKELPLDAVRIPRAFYDDHAGRDLDTPEALRETKTHVWVSASDKHYGELVDDAQFYADPAGPGSGSDWFVRSAKATLRALGEKVPKGRKIGGR